MSDLELCKLRTASPASGTVELIRRCHWAHDLIEAQAARIAAADALADAIDSDRPRVIGEALHAYRLTALKGQTHD